MAKADARVDWIRGTGDRLDVSLSATHRRESPLSITRDGSLIGHRVIWSLSSEI
jgi:hypothetical protein